MTGFELKLWRRGQQWTQQEAANQFGISLATYKGSVWRTENFVR